MSTCARAPHGDLPGIISVFLCVRLEPPDGRIAVMNMCGPAGFITETIVDAYTNEVFRNMEGVGARGFMFLAAVAAACRFRW